ncbi:MAG TPA: cupin domain-containing protein, partial [Afifellaceae bacterium]|nr:cupin domain-containing protein [Afifellaceae bacterium]
MDLLSDILSHMRLSGTLYFRTSFTSPWSIRVPAFRNVARFHFAHRGRCLVRISPDKDAVLRESFRVLRPGGRFAISDIVLRRALPEPVQRLVGLWTGCIAGALLEADYAAKLTAAGFVDVGIEPTHVFDHDDLVGMAADM